MATIRKIKTKKKYKYQADVRLHGYPRKTRLFDLKRDARKWADSFENSLRNGKNSACQMSTEITVSIMINKFLNEFVESDYKSEQYRKDIKYRLCRWKGVIGDFLLCNVTTRILVEKRNMMLIEKPKRTPSTINRYFSALSAVFTKAVNEWQYMEYNPVRSIRPLKEPTGRTRWLSDDERKRLIKNAILIHNKPMYELIVLAISTGARKSELLGIKKQNVLLKKNKILIENTKNRSNRALYINDTSCRIVKSLISKYPQKTYLFSSKKGDVPMTIEPEWKNLLGKSNIKNFRFHDLRHTAAAYLAMNGATLNEIAELLGHKTFNMTKRYAHIADSHLKQVSEKMQNKILKMEYK